MNRYLTEKVRSIEPLGSYRLRVTFTDGFAGSADLEPLLETGPIFDPWRDTDFFQHGWRIVCGVPEWGDDLDLSPGSLRAWCEAGHFMDFEETDAWIAAHEREGSMGVVAEEPPSV
jgi:hypothetical protein